MWARDINRADASHVIANMRARDRREIEALRWDDFSDEELTAATLASYGWVLGDADDPIMAIGVMPRWPGVWSAWMFATDKLDKIRFSATRWVRRYMIPTLMAAPNIRVVDCYSIEGYDEIHRWLSALGATKSAPLEDFGKGGETFYRFHRVLHPR